MGDFPPFMHFVPSLKLFLNLQHISLPYFHNSDALTLSYIHFYPATFTFSLPEVKFKI